jgi:type IV pilus assembly protein PilY1
VTGNQSLYQSPIKYSCQKNYVVYLTDGLPTQDNNADNKIISLPNFQSVVGTADCDDTGPGRCLDDMADYLFHADLSGSLTGTQNVITYTIGFGPEVAGSSFLDKVAQRGGGKAYTADDTATLENVLTNIVTEILQTNTTFTAPSVSVNAFNRTQTLDDIYVSLFRPSEDVHWPGNVKKYKFINGVVRDSLNNAAVDLNTGFFKDTAQSFWSATADGGVVDVGGAASRIPDPALRKVYTYLGTNSSLTNAANDLTVGNAGLTAAALGLGAPGLPTRVDLIEWLRGRDVQDENENGNFTEARKVMGDPIHAKPAIVIYGGTAASPSIDDAVVYSVTNDGYLHAFDVLSGVELWSFIPQELLANMPALYENATSIDKQYTLDGDLRVVKIDRNSNGVVEPGNGDRVYLYFGMRRGGSNYYAIDITDKISPSLMWVIGSSQLPGIGETWSTPALAKVNVGGATQNADKFVLVFGGGYQDNQDNPGYSVDTLGNRIFMVDAVSGARLWFAGGTGVGAPNLSLTAAPHRMNNSIPGDIVVLDTNSDGFADRMYAGDMGGRVWRFDIINGQSAASLVTGGVIATVGAADLGASPPLTEVRRFYSAPDVALVRNRSGSFYAIAIGSGYRGHPLNTTIRDRFYLIKDKTPFAARTQAQANAVTPIIDSGLVNVTDNLAATVPATADGWKLDLRDGLSSWIGEKSLSSPTIFGGRVFFTTYLPQTGASADPCTPGQGTNRAFAVSLQNGAPVTDLDGNTATTTREDRYVLLHQGGIAPGYAFLFSDNGNGGRAAGCLSGVEVIPGVCLNSGTAIRTFWQESGTN